MKQARQIASTAKNDSFGDARVLVGMASKYRNPIRAALQRFCILAVLVTGVATSGVAQFAITSTSPLPQATVGSAYSFQFQVAGGSQPYTWSASGIFSIPQPFGLSGGGLLQGTPDSPGQFNVGVKVTDVEGLSASKTFSLTVLQALVVVTQSPLPAGSDGQPYQVTLLGSGGAPPYSWNIVSGSGALPPGYFLNSQTGQISGTTTQPGSFQFSIRLADSQQNSVIKLFSLAVQAGKLGILPDPPLPAAFVGETYAVQLMPTSGSALSWAIVAGALPPGLRLSPQTGSITGTPTEPGTFVWTALLQDPDGAGAVREYSILVGANPKAPPGLEISSTPLNFSFASGGQAAVKGLRIRNTGTGAVPVTVQTSTKTGGTWLSVIPPEGVATAAEPLDVLVQADPGQSGASSFLGNITVTAQEVPVGLRLAPGETAVLPASMSISTRRQFLRLSLDGLTFTAVKGGGNPPPLTFDVINDGADPMPFATTVAPFPSAGWLQTPGAQAVVNPRSRRPISVQVNPGSLDPGVYFALIEVRAAGAAGEIRLLTVVLNLLPAGSRPPLVVEPTGLLFLGTAGGASPQSQRFVISNVSATSVGFTSRRFTEGETDTLTHSPEQGQVLPNQPLSVTVQPNTAGLTPGLYRSLIVLTFADSTQRTINATLVLAPAGSPTLSNAGANVDCPSALNVTIASFSGGYPSYVDAPAFLRAQVADDCGQPLVEGTGRSVRAERAGQTVFLSHKESGAWEATLDFETSGSQTIEVSAQDLVRGIIGNATIEDNVQPQLAVRPEIDAGGVVHGASFSQPPLAPGSMISTFGEQQSTNPTGAITTTLPLPEIFEGTRVRAGGVFLPLFFSSARQVNAGLPLALNPDSGPLSLVVFRGSLPSDPAEVSLATANPGLFTLNASGAGEGIYQDINFRLVSSTLPPASNPGGRQGVKPGEAVIIYATGLGAVAPTVASGQAASVNPLSHATGTVQLTIGGQNAVTDFKGLAPGFVSLYQINALVPAGLPPGNAEVILTVNGVSSPTGLTLSIE